MIVTKIRDVLHNAYNEQMDQLVLRQLKNLRDKVDNIITPMKNFVIPRYKRNAIERQRVLNSNLAI